MEKFVIPDEKQSTLRRLGYFRENMEDFSTSCLKIRNKTGQLVPLTFSPLQRILHASAEAQKAEMGMVRTIVVKYRRGGASTYILGRGYHRASLFPGTSVAIVAHISQSTNALYRIVKRFQDSNPIAPPLATSNVRGLEFAGMDSRYGVFSAENEEGGRGDEISFLHVSEAAYAPNLEALMSGLGNCVSDVPGTEIWLESTAKDSFGDFYDRCMDCIAGAGQYRLVFVPWSVDPDCSSPAPDDFLPNSERDHEGFASEAELMEMHNLTLDQIFWRRKKMGSGKRITKFSREYPLTVTDAFNTVGEDSFIPPIDIARARKATIEPYGAIVIGVDPASMGGDRFAICVRQGRKILSLEYRTKVKFNEGIEWVKSVIEDAQPDRVFIDAGGGGNGDAISSSLRDDPKYQDIVFAVNFGSTSQSKLRRPDKPGPKNRRAEMWGRLSDVVQSLEGLDIPDRDDLQADMSAQQVVWVNQEGDWQLVPKAKLKAKSADLGDSLALTYADDYVKPLHPARKDDIQGTISGGSNIQGLPPAQVSWMG